MDKLWIVGRVFDDAAWEFQGIFSTEEQARGECKDGSYFIGPCILDEKVTHERKQSWPGVYFPYEEQIVFSVSDDTPTKP